MSIIREADDKYEFFYPVYKKACWLVSATKMSYYELSLSYLHEPDGGTVNISTFNNLYYNVT